MDNRDLDEQEEKPLDPAMENVRRKMVKLQLVSGGIMLLMFMAVLAAIIYKVTRPDGTEQVATTSSGFVVPSDQPVTAVANLPAGFEVRSTSLSGGQILFYGVTAEGQQKALVFDMGVGRIVADIAVSGN